MIKIIVLISLIFSSQAFCQTLQDQERQKAFDNFDNASKAALLALENLSKTTKRQCLAAVSNETLCSCLTEKLPIKINFVQYVSIVTLTKEELGYEKLSPEDKKVVDLTRGARDQCIVNGR